MQPLKSLSSSLIGATGDCILAFTPQRQIVCALLPSRMMVGVWPYNSLRMYWGGKERFGFKAGRRSPRGEGEFIFITEQGEMIYKHLKRIVGLTSLVSKGQIVDPVSANPDPTLGETPVASSDSDEEQTPMHLRPPPPIPTMPADLSKRHSMGALPTPPVEMRMTTPTHGVTGTELSETGPAYFVNTSPRTLREAVSSEREVGLEVEPHPVDRTSPLPLPVLPQDDATYSHTAHELPQRFLRNASLKVTEGDYHGLVRTDSTKSAARPNDMAQPGTAPADGSAAPEDNMLYDVAFPPVSQQLTVLTPVHEGDYGSMGDPESQKVLLSQKRMQQQGSRKMLSETNIPFGAQLRGRAEGNHDDTHDGVGRQQSDNTMTSNPAYGSTEDLLSIGFAGNVSGYRQSNFSDPLTDSMVSNPVYGEHTPRLSYHSSNVIHSDEARLVPDERPMSPYEDPMIVNPLYATRSDFEVVHQKEVELAAELRPVLHCENTEHSVEVTGGHCDGKEELDSASGDTPSHQLPPNAGDAPQITSRLPPTEQQVSAEFQTTPLAGAVPNKLDIYDSELQESADTGEVAPMLQAEQTMDENSNKATNGATRDVHKSKVTGEGSSRSDGYSKVDKKKQENGSEVDGQERDESPPPPIPPRKYSNSSDS